MNKTIQSIAELLEDPFHGLDLPDGTKQIGVLAMKGYTINEIACALEIAPISVQYHLKIINDELNTKTRDLPKIMIGKISDLVNQEIKYAPEGKK